MKRVVVARRGTLLALAVLALTTPAPAHAGSYYVTGGCGPWTVVPDMQVKPTIATFSDCAGVYAQNILGGFKTVWGKQAYWRFTPPAGSLIGRVWMSGTLIGTQGWVASVMSAGGVVLEQCRATSCPAGGRSFSLASGTLSSDDLTVSVACLDATTCPNDKGFTARALASNITVEILDSTAPSVAITGGSLLSGWQRAGGSLTLSASDNVGIKLDRVLVDGVPRGQLARPCGWGALIPCPNGGATLTLDTTVVPDGLHTVTAQVVDSADNVGGQSAALRVDNTAPTAPLAASVAGGSDWRATNRFDLSWVNPPQPNAPIAAARYRLCPLGNAASDDRGCVTRTVTGADIHSLGGIEPPGPGAWRTRIWLVDAAGNENPAAAAETILRFDDTPPTVVFRKPLASDPARVRVAAGDAVSPVTSVAIEARHRGDAAWTSLSTDPRGSDFTAFVDDEHLPRGTYDLRARAVDSAGNERTSTLADDGHPADLTLPVRRPATLSAGRRTRVCSRASHCATRLDHDPDVALGQRLTLHGRLIVANHGTAAPIEVWRRVQIDDAPWERVATLESSKTGVFRYVAPRGPSRKFRFRFAGTPTARGATANVDARVRASTTMTVNHHDVVNGEYVTFRGRLRGGHIPDGGKLVELQVFTRRRWRTFALPRADARTGRWSYMYRFETITGRARFRFRARIRPEAGYPFHTGGSGQVAVTVQGI